MKMSNVYKALRFTMFTGTLLLHGFESLHASDNKSSERTEVYKRYFEQQEKIYKEIADLRITGARSLNIDEKLAEQIAATGLQEIKNTILGIEQRTLIGNEKSIILHGSSGTGKSGIAQAMAIQTQTPCLFFNAGEISTEYMNSGVQNLDKIFNYAKSLEKRLGKSCFIIFDELEALTKKHANQNNSENNILTTFWQKLDQYRNSQIFVVGTMNNTNDLPVQITGRASMVYIPLPTPEQRAATLSYWLKIIREQHSLTYNGWVNGSSLTRQTKGFSNRDLLNVVERATKPARQALNIPGINNKFVPYSNFKTAIKEISKDPQTRLKRQQHLESLQIGTWRHSFRTTLRNPKVMLPAIGIMTMIGAAYNNNAQQEASRKQAQQHFEYQTSTKHMFKQAVINSICALPVSIIGGAFKIF